MTRFFHRCRPPGKRCVHAIVRKQGPITTSVRDRQRTMTEHLSEQQRHGGAMSAIALTLGVPAFALGHAHIFEAPSYRDGVEVFEAVLHGDGAWRFGRWIAVPAAEAADDPSGPGKAVGRMRVPEPFTLGLEILVEGAERCDLVGIEGKPDRLIAATIARLQELERNDRRLGGDRDQLKEPVGGGALDGFELEALRLEDAEELLDQPAPLVAFHTAPGLFCI